MTKKMLAGFSLIAMLTVLLAVPSVHAAPSEGKTIRVACVGDSITFGAGIKDRKNNSYPVQLGKILGDGWEVINCGVSARTMLKKGDFPYWNERAFTDVLSFNPNTIIITYHVTITKKEGDLTLEADGNVYLEGHDDTLWMCGLIGLRTFQTDLWWDNIKVIQLK